MKNKLTPVAACFLGFIIGAAIVLALILKPVILPPNAKEREFLKRLELSLLDHAGRAKLGDLLPDGEWDTVCIVPAYAFAKNSKNLQVMRRFLGSRYEYNVLTTPNPLSVSYGLGLALLRGERLLDFLMIPSNRSIKVPEHSLRNKTLNRLYFSDLNVRRQDKDQNCYPRSTAFIKFNSFQDVTIGG